LFDTVAETFPVVATGATGGGLVEFPATEEGADEEVGVVDGLNTPLPGNGGRIGRGTKEGVACADGPPVETPVTGGGTTAGAPVAGESGACANTPAVPQAIRHTHTQPQFHLDIRANC